MNNESKVVRNKFGEPTIFVEEHTLKSDIIRTLILEGSGLEEITRQHIFFIGHSPLKPYRIAGEKTEQLIGYSVEVGCHLFKPVEGFAEPGEMYTLKGVKSLDIREPR